MRDDAGMVLTTAKYYLPDGTTIAGTGVEPDVAIEVNEETFSQVRLSLLHRESMSAEQFETIFGFALLMILSLMRLSKFLPRHYQKVRLPLEKTAHDPWYREFV